MFRSLEIFLPLVPSWALTEMAIGALRLENTAHSFSWKGFAKPLFPSPVHVHLFVIFFGTRRRTTLFLGAKRAWRVRRSAWAGVGAGTAHAVAGSGRLLRSALLGRSRTEQALCAAGPWRPARASAKHRGLASPGESLPQPQGHKENGSSQRHRGQGVNFVGCFSVVFPRSHPHEESRRGEADRARMACFTWASRHPGSCHSPSSASWLSPYPQALPFA